MASPAVAALEFRACMGPIKAPKKCRSMPLLGHTELPPLQAATMGMQSSIYDGLQASMKMAQSPKMRMLESGSLEAKKTVFPYEQEDATDLVQSGTWRYFQ